MIVYHGSTQIVKTPLVNIGRRNLDFGQGFYFTDIEEQAISWASRPLNAQKTQVINVYNLDAEAIITTDIAYKRFVAYNGEWLDFVVANRRGEQLWREYDVIEGGIANDRVFNTIELYSNGLIDKQTALQKLQYEKPNNQICILKQSVADCYLHFIEAKIIREGGQP